MSSNIEIKRICLFCNSEFTARTTVTKYCSLKCSSKAYKDRTRKNKIEKSNTETIKIISKPIEDIKIKEFLNINEVSKLIGISKRTIYRIIEQGDLKKFKIRTRTIIKRSDLNKFIEQPKPETVAKPQRKIEFDFSECYTITEVQEKFSISSGALYNVLKRNNVPKKSKGKFVFVPKQTIDNLLK